MDADRGELRGRDPGGEEVDAAADVLRHAEGSCEGVDGAGGVREDREARDAEVLADGADVICMNSC